MSIKHIGFGLFGARLKDGFRSLLVSEFRVLTHRGPTSNQSRFPKRIHQSSVSVAVLEAVAAQETAAT